MITFLTPFWRRDALGHSHPYLACIRNRGALPLSPPPLFSKEARKVVMTSALLLLWRG